MGSGLCKAEVQSLPDASFHYVLVIVALLLVGLLTVPIYWGSGASKELFDNFYYIWAKLKNGDEECKDVEWKRRMHFVLDQLKSSKKLTTRYALYHGLALVLDLLHQLEENVQLMASLVPFPTEICSNGLDFSPVSSSVLDFLEYLVATS